MPNGPLVLLALLLSGGSGRLLDYVPTQLYWQERNVEITVDHLIAEATPPSLETADELIQSLAAAEPARREDAVSRILEIGESLLPKLQQAASSPDPELAQRARLLLSRLGERPRARLVRRLLAIRGLGELKDAKASPFLRSQLDSPEPFVADMARQALDRIEGRKPVPATELPGESEVWRLPATCSAVGQIFPRAAGPLDLEYLQAHLPVPQGLDVNGVIRNYSHLCLDLAERIGDARLDTLSLGATGDLDAQHGSLVVIASGQFDAKAADAMLRRNKLARTAIDQTDVFSPDGDTDLCFPDDHHLLLVASPAGANRNLLTQVLKDLAAGNTPLRQNPALATTVEKILRQPPGARVLWATSALTDNFQRTLLLNGGTGLTLTASEHLHTLTLRATVAFADAASAKSASQTLSAQSEQLLTQLRAASAATPALAPIADALGGLKIDVNASTLRLGAAIEESPATLFALPMVMTSGLSPSTDDMSLFPTTN